MIMTFGQAIEAMKTGKRVMRKGWNGKGMFIYYVPGSEVATANFHPDIVRYYFQSAGKNTVKINSHIDMKSADGSVAVGWLASQTDMQADDWVILE